MPRNRRHPPGSLNVANLLSITRLLLLPVFFYFLTYYLRWLDEDQVAGAVKLYYYVTVGLVPIILLTDFLDGWLARKFDLVNPLGAFLDPLADKCFAFFTMVIFAWVEVLPVWLVLLVFFKEMFILTGWVLLFILDYDTEIAPSNLGKFTAVCQGVVVASVLLTLPGGERFSWQALPLYEFAELFNRPWFHILTAVATALSGTAYMFEGQRRAHPISPAREGVTVLPVEEVDRNLGKK